MPEVSQVVSLDPISIAWVTDTRLKRLWLPWEITAVSMKNKSLLDSISERPRQFWTTATALNIRKFFRPQSTAKRQFNCKLIFSDAVLKPSCNSCTISGCARPKHAMSSCRRGTMTCQCAMHAAPLFHLHKNLSEKFGRCPSPTPVSHVTFREHRCHVESTILEVQNIILKLES